MGASQRCLSRQRLQYSVVLPVFGTGATALTWASFERVLDGARLLLPRGAAVDRAAQTGVTPPATQRMCTRRSRTCACCCMASVQCCLWRDTVQFPVPAGALTTMPPVLLTLLYGLQDPTFAACPVGRSAS